MMGREEKWLKSQTAIDEMEGAGQEKISSLHTSMLLQETIAWNVDKNNPVHVAFLDIRKAFDTVWVNGLLYKLYKLWLTTKNSPKNDICSEGYWKRQYTSNTISLIKTILECYYSKINIWSRSLHHRWKSYDGTG